MKYENDVIVEVGGGTPATDYSNKHSQQPTCETHEMAMKAIHVLPL